MTDNGRSQRCPSTWHGIQCAEDVDDHERLHMHMTDPNRPEYATWRDSVSDQRTRTSREQGLGMTGERRRRIRANWFVALAFFGAAAIPGLLRWL